MVRVRALCEECGEKADLEYPRCYEYDGMWERQVHSRQTLNGDGDPLVR